MDRLEEYQKINNSFKKEVIYHFGLFGFYSEFNNMILAMLYCLERGIKFKLYSKDAIFALGNGWNDYFLPFCGESKNSFHSKLNYRIDYSNISRIARILIFIYRLRYHNTYLTYDVFSPSREDWTERKHFEFPSLGIEGDLRDSAKCLIEMTYKFNLACIKEIDDIVKSIEFPKNYIGIHIRGGDKITEHKLYPIQKYIEKAQSVSSLRNAFIMTDDYLIYEMLVKNYPDWRFYSSTMEDEKGYDHYEFLKRSKERKKKHMMNLFASAEIIKKSDAFIGTFSSNIGTFLGMYMPREIVYGIDYDNWMIF